MYTPLNWTTTQRHVAFASFTSWMLDAFDFFILVFVLSDLAEWFHASVSEVSIAIMLTLAVRPIGALLFGRMAEKYGRRPILMLNILFFTVLNCFPPGRPPSWHF
ncbi:metabolite transport protein [Salmonella enterica subsp. arizonae]|uniref:Metabolite transport protein n=1 Tax=Salmonella enterica subsp. arizonae TaxID=59203 RepID=A0A3S4GX77_SALER|nr:metabolite transport protein [Salmonella enterica subsp. arizonae]